LLAVKFDDQTHAAVPAPRSIADVGLADLLAIAFAEIVADRVYILEQGQIRWTGMMQDLVRNSEIQRSYSKVNRESGAGN
jgi:ABC-type polar amino acid transport system ATPase subunit